MGTITLTFDNTLNTSVQVGDTVYRCTTTDLGGFSTSAQSAIIEVGTITSINKVNMTSPLGYFAKAKFENNSTSKSEMFTAACDIFESSK